MVLCWAFAAIGVEEQGGWEAGGRAGGMGGRWKSRGDGRQVEEQGYGSYRRREGAIQVAYTREAQDVRNTNKYI